MEVLNDLLGYKNIKIYQNTDYFCFTLDTVLLANFVKINVTTRKILDIGTGTAAIPLILSLRTKTKIDAIDVQKELISLAKKSINYNKLEHQINLIEQNVFDYYKLKNNYYDVIICNPPYYSEKSKNKNNIKSIARHTGELDIDGLIKVSKCMLKNKGKLNIVYDNKNLIEILNKLRKNNLEPKRIKFAHDNYLKNASMVLIECVKNGKCGMEVESPVILKDENMNNTKLYNKILCGGFLYESKKL